MRYLRAEKWLTAAGAVQSRQQAGVDAVYFRVCLVQTVKHILDVGGIRRRQALPCICRGISLPPIFSIL